MTFTKQPSAHYFPGTFRKCFLGVGCQAVLGTIFSSDSDVKTEGKDGISAKNIKYGINKLILHSDKYLNRFVDHDEKMPSKFAS